ncbi:flavin monoamine oxidase family protein [Azorhizobium doebereinerae]|uniref:flavin monoamine oxidase family protein n=1 Tax=Azorhizobium doebereinerae TaxID=281091 RepID=UPI0003F4EE95|nr:FAD-dependent oxidoreductase [Azorhizobium doebereinerae]
MADLRTPTRRTVLQRLGQWGGAGLAFEALTALGLLASPPARAEPPRLPPDLGRGRSVVVIGAGLSGLCAGLLLARGGFDVAILEATGRAGGRSYSMRNGHSFAEEGGPRQRVDFVGEGAYFNAGAGRIPRNHGVVLDWCRRLGVALEPYIFMCESNLFQNDAFNGGQAVPLGQLRYSLYGALAELLDKAIRRQALDLPLPPGERDALRGLIARYGDLTRRGEAFVFEGSRRLGYSDPPGAGDAAGTLRPPIPLEQIVGSDAADLGLFSSMLLSWQNSLLEPVGGMDMIAAAFLRQDIPGGRQLRDIVQLNCPVAEIGQDADTAALRLADGRRMRVDFLVSTMAPTLFTPLAHGLPAELKADLDAIRFVAATKVGFETRSRFWEADDGIYGGISFLKEDISQVWYPSAGFGSPSGVLTAAYARGAPAERLAALPLGGRFEAALRGGEKLHPNRYRANMRLASAISVAWAQMPYFAGGWSYEDEATLATYDRLVKRLPWGRVYMAGDTFSHLPGWQEGALSAGELAARQIGERVAAGRR